MQSRVEKLSSGYWVRIRKVPPHVYTEISEKYKYPEPPTIKVESVAGHTEELPAPSDSDEMRAYRKEIMRIKAESDEAGTELFYDYAVMSWSDNNETWQTEPPADWELDPILLKHGIQSSQNRRVDFIRLELITDNADLNLIYGAKLSTTSEAAIAAAEEQFPGDGSQRKAVTQPTTKRGRHKG